MAPKAAASKRAPSNPAPKGKATPAPSAPKAKSAAAPKASPAAKAAAQIIMAKPAAAPSKSAGASASPSAEPAKAASKASKAAEVEAEVTRSIGLEAVKAPVESDKPKAKEEAKPAKKEAQVQQDASKPVSEEAQSDSKTEEKVPASKGKDESKAEEAGAKEEPQKKDAAEDEQKAKEAQQAAVEAELKRLAALANGEVTVKYEMYHEKFPIENHRLTASTIDELYCLSDVMPGCYIHLADKEYVHGEERTYVKEDPPGTFLGLMAGETYWCVVEQDPEQEKKDQARMRTVWAGGVAAGVGDRGSEGETCSCGWGAPCTNPMICKDWDNRFANAIKAGGNPILFNTTAS